MNFAFKSLQEFNDYFKDEKTCYEFLALQRWDNKPVCPHCGSEKVYTVKTRSRLPELQGVPSYRCGNRACDKPFTAKVGSIFEGSKIPLRKWFQGVYEISTSKKGISSIELATRLGTTQRTAWFIGHRVRAMLTETQPDLLEDIVEADETFVGGKNKNRHANKKVPKSQGRSHLDKTAVLGLVQRNGKVRTFVVPDCNSETLQNIMVANVAKDAVLITDAYNAYNGLEKVYTHIKVKHTENNYKTDRHFHTNNIEGYWSILKRGIVGIYHYVSPKHLHRYCNEFASRYNARKVSNLERFTIAITQCANARITYKNLISSNH